MRGHIERLTVEVIGNESKHFTVDWPIVVAEGEVHMQS